MSTKRVLLVVLVASALSLAVRGGSRVRDLSLAQELLAPADTWTFQGRVYAGEVGAEPPVSQAIEGVTVSVYGSNNPYPDAGIFIRSTTTDAAGWYALDVYDDDGIYEFYHIRETDPAGYSSAGATTVDGTVRTDNWIEYAYPLDGQTLTGNKFWDQLPVLSGRVYEGAVGDESHPLEGVTVSLYGANNPYPDSGAFIASTMTDAEGWYGLEVPAGYEYYHLRETDLSGYTSEGASSVDGTVRTDNWIEYVIPLEGKTLTDNKFWDTGPPLEWTFEGQVFEGDVGDESSPLGGVTVSVYGSNNPYPTADTLIRATTTDGGGSFSLTVSEDDGTYEYYHLRETDLSGYTSVGASSVGGSVRTDNWIEYVIPLDGKTLTGNKFWDEPEVVMPDLVVTDLWNDGADICYQVMNVGNATAAGGHSTALIVDGGQRASDLVEEDLGPEERWSGCFDYAWVCTPSEDSIAVSADYDETVDERVETNNVREETWLCDTTAPQIISGPTVLTITQDSAVISWETDEDSDSLVKYSKTARGHVLEKTDPTLAQSHNITLTGLDPSTTYRYTVRSADASGNAVESGAHYFETSPLADASDPVLSIIDPGLCRETVTIVAEASDDVGVAKVEFYLDDELILTDYSPPYNFKLDTLLYANGNYSLKAKAYDVSGRMALDQDTISIVNLVDLAAPKVNIYHPTQGSNVYGQTPVYVTVQDDKGWSDVEWFLEGKRFGGGKYPTSPSLDVQFWWDTRFLTNGGYTLAVQATDEGGKVGSDSVYVYVSNTQPALQPKLEVTKHEVFRHGKDFVIELTVENKGQASADAIEIRDTLSAFQVIDRTFYGVEYSAEFDSSSMQSTCVIKDADSLAKGSSRTYVFSAVPVLVYPNPPTPAVGSAIKLTYGGPLGKKHQDPTKFAVSHTTAVPSQTPSEALATAHANAVKQANYLIVTVPQLIFTHNKGNSGFVNSLLSDMADLARLQNGVLGYFKYGYWKYTLKGLISPGGGWASKLHPNFSKVPGIGGYVLIVGETEIIPAWTMSGFNRKFEGGTKVDVVDHSDHPYADAYGGWPPDLIVARIIGDAVGLLRQAVRASIAGLAYDRSHALLVSGLPPYQDSFVKSVNDLAGKLGGMGVTSKKIHWKDYGSDTDRLLEFRKWAPDRDLILYRGHGTPTRWSDGLYSGWVLTNSGDFGNAYPVVIALACNTGNYEFTGDYGIAEHFFDSNAAVYIGSTEISSGPHNDNGGKHILENWGTDKTIGWAFTYSERALPVWDGDNETWWRFWAAEYNLYGDPKYGAVNPPASSQASVPTVAQTQEPLPSLDVTVPDYQVDTVDGVDHVEIPGGKTLLEEGRPQVPYYAVTVDYPLGYKVQDVNLTDKSGLTVTTGLNIPLTTMIPDGSSADASSSPLAEGGDWYPKGAYDWRAFDNPDGSTTLVIQIYPFFYNALTTDVRFYRDYGFDITYTESHVDITSLTIDQDEYRQGDVVGVEIELDNADAAQDVIVSAWIERYSSGEIVDGLQLKTLTGLSRQASFSAQWDSAGFEPGYYRVVATVKDSDENLLDTRTGLFRLGISSGAITGFSATPTLFDVGDDIDISLEFSNTGTISVTGTAIIRVLDENGGLVQEFKHDIIGLASGSAAQFDDEWNASSEGTYTVLGYVQYDSHATAPATSVISTEVRTYLPVVVEVSQ